MTTEKPLDNPTETDTPEPLNVPDPLDDAIQLEQDLRNASEPLADDQVPDAEQVIAQVASWSTGQLCEFTLARAHLAFCPAWPIAGDINELALAWAAYIDLQMPKLMEGQGELIQAITMTGIVLAPHVMTPRHFPKDLDHE